MFKRLLTFLAFIFFTISSLHSQEPAKKPSCGCRFQSINQIGLNDGSMDTDFQIQTINGLRFNNWFTGIGIGIDYYNVRSVPIFFDVRNYWFNRKNSPFAYADIGVSFPWAKEQFAFDDVNYNQGLYTDFGLGYKLGLGNTHALSLSLGYSFKRLSGKRKYNFCPFLPPCAETTEEFDYRMNRISMKFGWEF